MDATVEVSALTGPNTKLPAFIPILPSVSRFNYTECEINST
jgi:uncharacterized protein YraI